MAAILSLRLLPPFAIARLGSGETPMDNYTLDPSTDPDAPLAFRKLKARPTFKLHENAEGDVEIVNHDTPEAPLQFKELDAEGKVRIRPVAPFLEAFAQVEGVAELQPLTPALLRDSGFDLAHVRWSVCVANRKVARRTHSEDDAVVAVAADISGHKWVKLEGRAKNFVEDGAVAFGKVCFIKPTHDHPEIRLRFHPGKGLIYGPVVTHATDETDPLDPNLTVYKVPEKQQVYKNLDDVKTGFGWHGLDAREAEREKAFFNDTLPPALFAINPPAPNWLFDNVAVSRGYLDDACDGFVELRLEKDDTRFSAMARICVGPPATAPDALFVRSLADDLDQAILGTKIHEEPVEQTRTRALDIVRRAFETVSFMNVAVMNGNSVNGRPALILDSMPEEEAADTQRAIRPVMAPSSVDTFAIQMLHQQAYAAMRGGAAPWFARLLRRPDEAADYTDYGRRKMPALMCGADNNYLALTWRQIHTIEKSAAAGPTDKAPGELAQEETHRALKPRNLTAQIRYAAAGNPINALPVTAVANCCPGLEVDFRAIWRRLFKGVELREWDNLVVRAGPDAAALVEPPEIFEDIDSYTKPHCKLSDMVHHRLLRVRIMADEESKRQKIVHVVGRIKGPASSDLAGMINLTTSSNPEGVTQLEWSNALAPVLDYARTIRQAHHAEGRRHAPIFVRCDFSVEKSQEQQVAPPADDDFPASDKLRPPGFVEPEEPEDDKLTYVAFKLEVRPFFEDDTAVISRALARAGELTQGLCSPWQNDFRECSCYYWASARPDFVNVETDASGLSVGDNWMQRERTGRYVADDYKDARLMMYDELFNDWESKLKFEIGGRDDKEPEPNT